MTSRMRHPGIVVPLSYSQSGQLFLEVMWPSRPPSHLMRCFRVGDLDRAMLEMCLHEIARRHSSLRTAFAVAPASASDHGRAPLRVRTSVASDVPIALQTIGSPNDPMTLDEALEAAAVEAERRFVLDEPPLMRVMSARTGPKEHLLVLVLHHLIADRWSMDVLEDELMACYHALRQHRCPPPWPPAMQYFEFARSEHERLASGVLDRSIEFWKRRWELYGRAQLTIRDFPFGRADGDGGFDVERERVLIDAALTRQLEAFARRRRQSVYTLLLTAFVGALRQVTGSERIAVFGTFANRTSVATEGAVGWFANAHLLGISCAADTAFERLAGDVFGTVLDASEHQAVPPGLLWATDGARAFRSDAWVSFDYVGARLFHRTTGPRPDVVPPRLTTGPIGLRLFAHEVANGVVLVALYSQRYFLRSGVAQLLGTMKGAIVALLTDPAMRLGDVECLTSIATGEPC